MSTRGRSAVAGLACAAVAIGVAELAAAVVTPASAPVVAVGAAVITFTPEPVKEFAIAVFGVYDKLALVAGIGLILAIIAAVIGVACARRPWIGYGGLAGFGLLGVVAAVTRPGSSPWWALPSLIGVLAAMLALRLVFRRRVALDGPETARPPVPGRDVDRRGVLIGFGVAGVAGLAGWRVGGTDDIERIRSTIELPRARSVGPSAVGKALDVKGITPYLTDTANDGFYRIDTALTLPRIDPGKYRLRIGGRVAEPLSLSYQELLDLPLVEREITLSCVSNEVGGELAGTARWLGVPLKDLLDMVKPDAGADQIVGRSADGWTCGTPTKVCSDGRDAMLAVGMDGEPLPIRHGFPVRMLVPGLYGYVSATKWLVELELSSFDDFDAYWVRRGWDAEAPIKTFSRIDTPTATKRVKPGRTPVAGIAWAQRRGIGAVEVRVDDGDWREAELAPVISTDTWRQWVLAWDATPGRHRLEVRATDESGDTQPEKRVTPFPNGATGWHSVLVNVE
ncbi:molybdopterin-dependent oxidoreductase [Stackebrandtia nassauensis]|uniref:Oxidoreductase molybdopterin binding protein n=1 Tax=Stackebrandtia nassauensis (strain DSM 44728 / CIP 108903 / NRRL B-16338 / NBRC 102104 / LLR-40K-21) TaxID=446470 RepID=D3Q004_STANL|nr:molybdopterin-dependent oxidoreductase [Stackebrandtia nassauensis]ADD45533.1 oxidoreductase molybdopterin binding protein [Stackebrandtia nassauensis DSM 44728]